MSAVEKWLAQPESIEQIRHHAPEGFDADRAKRSVLALLQADATQGGRLGNCTPGSLVLAVVQSAALGLELGTGDCYVIPYGKEATLSLGYRGMLKLAKRSGEITHIKAEVVYQGEEFEVWTDANGRTRLTHTLDFPRSEKPVVAVYAHITCSDGFVDFEVMDAGEIAKVQAASKSKMGGKTSPAWRDWYGEMSKKAVIRRALKRYTLAPEVEARLADEDRIIYAESVEVVAGPAKTRALNERLKLLPSAPSQSSDAPADPEPSIEAAGVEEQGEGGGQ